MNDRATWNSIVVIVVLAAICAVIGMFVLPLVFGPAPGAVMTLVWLVVAVVDSCAVIALLFQLSRPLASALGQSLGSASVSQTALLARLLMFGLALVTTQAILRHPIAVILGADGSSVSIESGIAAAALAAVLVTLVWVYQTARPMVQTVTLRAIDAAIPTTAAALTAEPTRTSISVMSSGPIPSATDAATLIAPLSVQPAAEVPTLVAGQVADATQMTGRPPDAEATLLAPRDDQATLVAHRDDDPTVRVQGA
ncbi:MAG: hypothetical protein JO057_31340 [Chloroflexi bacterium]|nr:hypothetical protein [Chloroflexota bacterium]